MKAQHLPTVNSALTSAITNGSTAESCNVAGYEAGNLMAIRDKVNGEQPLSADENNVLVYVLMDYASYGNKPEMTSALVVLDDICPDAAKDLREDNYMFQYLLEAGPAEGCPIH